MDSKYVKKDAFATQNSRGQWLGHWAFQHQLVLAKMFFKTRVPHSDMPVTQLDFVLMHRAQLKPRKGAETTAQLDMHSDHNAVIARIKLPIDHTTQIKRPRK